MQERRKAHRFAFLATAEVHEELCGAKIAVRVANMSISGCYLLMTNPLPKGKSILIKIRTKTEYFQCQATVVHSNQGDGMGLVFNDVSPPFVRVLQEWLFQSMVESSTFQSG
jgi:hypothetical protein